MTKSQKNHVFVDQLLSGISRGKIELNISKGEFVFSQGDKADSIYFITSGRVQISVISALGKEGIVAVLGPREFFGEGCLVGQSVRPHSAVAMTGGHLYRVTKRAMIKALLEQPELSELMIHLLISRNTVLEEDLCDQLFNKSEKRLARTLLKLARFGQTVPDVTVPAVSHETLAEMIGTTRERVTFFMNKFRKLGLLDYNGKIKLRPALLTDIVLNE